MGEKKFLNIVITESVLLLFLGFSILVLPKVVSFSFGYILCFSFLAYGGYKTINAFLTRTTSSHYILTMITGLILSIAGVLLYFAPMFNVMVIIALVGIYFILESINSSIFLIQTRNLFSIYRYNFIIGIFELLFGLMVIVLLPSQALWMVGVLVGIDFLLSGVMRTILYYSNKYIHR